MLRFRSSYAAFALSIGASASLLSGCGGGGSSSQPVPRQTDSPTSAGIESIASANAALAAGGGCGLRAVFVYRTGTARGYPLDASGETQPCAVIPVSNVWGPISVSRYGYVHVAAFQTGTSSYPVFAPNANGKAVPVRLVTAQIDRYSLATDSRVTDYIADGTNRAFCWEVAVAIGDGSTFQDCTSEYTAQVQALAAEPDDRLVVVMSDYTTPPRVELYTNASSAAPQLAQTITGAATLLPAAAVEFGATTDPANGDIYVYAAGPSVAPQVSVYASNANGNVAPRRVLTVPNATGAPGGPRGASTNVLAVDDRGQLYLALRNNAIVQIYAAGASGNAAPVRTITDASAPTTYAGFSNDLPTSVAIRTSIR